MAICVCRIAAQNKWLPDELASVSPRTARAQVSMMQVHAKLYIIVGSRCGWCRYRLRRWWSKRSLECVAIQGNRAPGPAARKDSTRNFRAESQRLSEVHIHVQVPAI